MSDPPLHILVIDTSPIRASIIEAGLREAGHDRVTVLDSTLQLMRRVVEIAPDVVVIDLENPDRDALEHMFQVSRAMQRPVAMFVDRADHGSIEAAIEAGVSAYVVDGLKKERIKPIMDTAISRFKAFDRLRRELARLLAQPVILDQPVGVLLTGLKHRLVRAQPLLLRGCSTLQGRPGFCQIRPRRNGSIRRWCAGVRSNGRPKDKPQRKRRSGPILRGLLWRPWGCTTRMAHSKT
jgi:two-component system, response regulator / RNA-binding antiterminator